MMVKIGVLGRTAPVWGLPADTGMQAQEFLSAFSSSEPLLTSLLSPCRSVFLFNNVVTLGCGDHLLVINVGQTRELPDRGSVTAELISMNDLWNVIFTQQSGQEGLRGRSVAVPLKEKIEHEPMLVDRPPQPMPDAIHARADLVEGPP